MSIDSSPQLSDEGQLTEPQRQNLEFIKKQKEKFPNAFGETIVDGVNVYFIKAGTDMMSFNSPYQQPNKFMGKEAELQKQIEIAGLNRIANGKETLFLFSQNGVVAMKADSFEVKPATCVKPIDRLDLREEDLLIKGKKPLFPPNSSKEILGESIRNMPPEFAARLEIVATLANEYNLQAQRQTGSPENRFLDSFLSSM